MAKQRPSQPLPRLSSTNLSEVSNTTAGTNINVGRKAAARPEMRSISSASQTSTPPTSLPEESVSDAASDKQAMDAQLTVSSEAGNSTSRRSSRRSAGPATYNIAALSDARRVSAGKTPKANEDRTFSGQTLVDEAQVTSPNAPTRKLVEQAFNLDWDINDPENDAPVLSKPTAKRKRRSSFHELVDTAKMAAKTVANMVLGKRERDDAEPGKDPARRSSRRLSALTFGQEKDQKRRKNEDGEEDEEDEEAAKRPSKMPRLGPTSSFSMPSLATTSTTTNPKPRGKLMKRFESQGLFVGQEFTSEKRKGKKRASLTMASAPPTQKSFMPLPMGSIMDAEKDFTIPWNVFGPQPRERGTKPYWGNITKNRFVGDAKLEWRAPEKLASAICICKTECGHDCWNRVTDHECDEKNCLIGPQCGNRDFSELETRMKRAQKFGEKSMPYLYNAGVEVIKTNDRGFGVRACREFQPNEIITEYTGEIITRNEAYRRINEDYAGKSDYYQMEFNQGMILDATRGSLARFVNHSCNPNCEMVKRNVSGRPRMALFAGEFGVMTGEELTYDYNFDPYSTTNIQACLCGASNCRKVLGPKPAGMKKPSSKEEMIAWSNQLRESATAKGISAASEPPEDIADLKKKRKVPQMSKGWAYIDPEWELIRQEEAAKDKKLRDLQRDGVIADVRISRPKYPSRGTVSKAIDKIKTSVSSNKSKAMKRLSGSFKRDEAASTAASLKRMSTISTGGSLRQSKISFQSRNVSGDSGEALIARPSSSGSSASKAKRNSIMSRTSSKKSSKRQSTVRMVTEDDE